MVDRAITLQRLLATRHAEIRLFTLFMTPTALARPFSEPEGAELFRQHLLYLWELEERGKLFGSGPLDPGTPGVEGMCIVVAADAREAEAIAAAEPFRKAGWRTTRIREWQLNEGDSVPVGRQLAGSSK